MAAVVTQSQAIAAAATLASLLAPAGANAHGNVGVTSRLAALAASAHAPASASAHGIGSITLAGAGQLAANQHATALSALGPLATSAVVQSLNVNTARIVATLPRLRAAGTVAAQGSLQATSRVALAAKTTTSALQAIHATALLRLGTSVSLHALASAYVEATLGPLSTSLRALPPAKGYAADGHYFVVIPSRPFYAPVNARPFYAPTPARTFYILSDPDMTPNFDTLDPRETLVLTLDASAELATGETLAAIQTMTATQQSGPTGTAPTLSGQLINTQPIALTVNGVPITIAVGAGVQVVASGGTSGCRYLIAATCTTSNADKILTLKGILPVSAS
jgi:hypothetical protein